MRAFHRPGFIHIIRPHTRCCCSGSIFDVWRSYEAGFYITGGCVAASALCLAVPPLLRSCRDPGPGHALAVEEEVEEEEGRSNDGFTSLL